MDIGLVELDQAAGTMWFSGAQSALVILRDSGAERIKGSSCSIGDPSGDSSAGFETHRIELQPSDRICLFSDGLIHQFGGPNGRKKFSSNQFMQRLEALNGQTAQEIGSSICAQHIDWQGQEEQTDDIILIGFSINGTKQAKAA
jgi:serine phosphatase RsbU (regulator of sigma subunit)